MQHSLELNPASPSPGNKRAILPCEPGMLIRNIELRSEGEYEYPELSESEVARPRWQSLPKHTKTSMSSRGGRSREGGGAKKR